MAERCLQGSVPHWHPACPWLTAAEDGDTLSKAIEASDEEALRLLGDAVTPGLPTRAKDSVS